jgi:hypothetical protein
MDPTGIAPSRWQGASESLDIRKHRARAVELFSKGIYRQHGLQSHRGGTTQQGLCLDPLFKNATRDGAWMHSFSFPHT